MTVNHGNYGFIKQIWYLLRRVIYYIEKKDMNICIYTVHSFLYECITCKLKSCLSNYCTYYISYVTTIIQNYHKITSKKKIILGGHPVALVGQAKDFHQHHIWCFPLPCTGENISLNDTHIPCIDQPWCPHIHQSWHPTETSDLVILTPPFSKNGSDCAVGNLHIYAPELDWLNSWFKLYCN